MFNPVIIVAILVQWFVARSSRIAGAVIGYIITTGILLWGWSIYGQGYQITLIGIPLPLSAFLIACLFWYYFDTHEFLAARKKASELKQTLQSPLIKASELKQTLQSPLIKDERVVSFYQTTRDAWLDGKLSSLGNGFKNEGLIEQEDFIKKYPPIEGSALGVFFEKFQTLKGEFMVGIGNLKTTNNSGWFVLTNLRLIQRDGRNDEFKEVILADVDSYQINGVNTKTLVFKMKSGGDITFEKVQMYPNDKFLSTLIAQRIEA